MKKISIVFAFLFLSISCISLLGADDTPAKAIEKGIVFGIGTNISPANFYLPVQITNNIRIEPMIGFSFNTNTYSHDANIFNHAISDTNNYDIIQNSFQFGFGGFYNYEPIKSTRVYSGLRFTFISYVASGINYSNYNNGFVNLETTQESYELGACFGGEYYLVKQFSLGVEAQLNFIYSAKPMINNSNSKSSMVNGKTVTNSTLVFIRYYFDY